MGAKGLHQLREIPKRMVVADRITSAFPDMLLRIELRTTGREVERLNAGMRDQKVTDGLSFVPLGAIPQEKQRTVGVAGLHMLEKMNGHFTGLFRQGQR